MASSINSYTPESWLSFVQEDYVYKAAESKFQVEYGKMQQAHLAKDDMRTALLKNAEDRIKVGPEILKSYWSTLCPDVLATLQESWCEILDCGKSLPVIKMSTIGMLLYVWVDKRLPESPEVIVPVPNPYTYIKDKVFTDEVIQNPSKLKRAAGTLDLDNASDIGLFFLICQQENWVKSKCNLRKFVRGLIGLEFLPVVDEDKIAHLADSASHKVRDLNKEMASRKSWNADDREAGYKIVKAYNGFESFFDSESFL